MGAQSAAPTPNESGGADAIKIHQENPKAERPGQLEQGFEARSLALGGITAVDIDYLTRQGVDERLESHGPNLLGDSVDLNTGALAFKHTDISIPGNSSLPVAITRTRQKSFGYYGSGGLSVPTATTNPEFGDWKLEVPRISYVVALDVDRSFNVSDHPFNPAGGCLYDLPLYEVEYTYQVGLQTYNGFQRISRHTTTDGISLEIPGAGNKKLVLPTTASNWPANTNRVTKDYFVAKCGSGAPNSAHYEVVAPDGTTYILDKFF